MRIVAKLKTVEEIEKLIDLGVDVLSVDTPLAVRGINKEIYDELDKIVKYNKPVYLFLNKMIHEDDIDLVRSILQDAKEKGVSGIVVGDITVMIIAREYEMQDRVIYQPGTMNTNSFDSDYFFMNSIKGITISKEITLEEIKKILENKKTEFSLVGHGFLDMFYSKRKLLSNYFVYKNIVHENIVNNQGFRLKEEMRKESFYPILEDEFGTHIFRDKALESFSEIKELEGKLDDFFVERIFLDDEEYYESIKAYKNEEFIPEFLRKYKDKYNKGFFYQYTEKLKGDLNES
ncbi:MAG: U32 family peptidase [Candidatus Izemoplasmatales bacterium]|nr:U32 family peptidase [Candidatus Izemoplasmatales bacterium]